VFVVTVHSSAASSTHGGCVTVQNYLSTSVVGDFDFAGWAGLAVGDTAVGELVVLLFGFGTLFGRGFALQVAGNQGVHGGL